MNELFAPTTVLDAEIAESTPDAALCEQCNTEFTRRIGKGGKPQRFCSRKCRHAFHAQREQRSPTCSNVGQLPALIQPEEKPSSETTPEDDTSEVVWFVPEQTRIECAATVEGEVEIEQISPLGDSDNQRIFVARGNAVRLARSILFAAGFKGILIATRARGGYCDVEDGDLPEQFED